MYLSTENFRRYSQPFCDLLSNLFRKSATNSIFNSLVVNKVSAGGFIWQDAVKTSESAAMDGGRADISRAVLRTEKPCWGYVYGATYAEVREISARKKAEYGIYNLNSTDITFSEISEQWLYSVRQGVKESTFSHYQYTLRHYLQPVFGEFKVSALSEKNFGAGTFGSDNTSQWKAEAFRGNHGTGVLVDAAAHLQVCSAFSSHSPFRDHGKAATKITKSTAAVYHRRTKEITVVRNGCTYAQKNRPAAATVNPWIILWKWPHKSRCSIPQDQKLSS